MNREMYRSPPEKKIVKHRITLTRGEVDRIVRAKLADEDKIPKHLRVEPLKGATRSLQWLTNTDNIQQPPVTAPWADWPAYYIEWEEEVPT